MCTFNYPEKYALTKEQQESVLSWFNTTKSIERSVLKHAVDAKSEDEVKIYSNLREKYETRLKAAQSILRSMGVFVEYNWPGHEHEYVLATKADAEDYEKAQQ